MLAIILPTNIIDGKEDPTYRLGKFWMGEQIKSKVGDGGETNTKNFNSRDDPEIKKNKIK